MSTKQKELRRMSRTELIEIIYALQQSERDLQQQLAQANAQLQQRAIIMDNAGSIAQAALGLNKVFEDAQAAADQYLESVKALYSAPSQEIDAQQQAPACVPEV